MQGGRIGVSSIPGKGSNFKFYIRARRAVLSKETKAVKTEKNTQEKPKITTNGDYKQDKDKLHVQDRNYVAPMNRTHSASQNPVVGSPSDPNTLYVLIVEVCSVFDLLDCYPLHSH